MFDSAELFVNVHARRGRQWFEPVVAALSKSGMRLDQALACRDVSELVAGVRGAVERGAPYVLVGGGDGTIGAVASVLAGSQTTLGIIPLGTGNQFGRDLGIPADVPAACAIARTGRPVWIDLGRVGDQYFLNVATVGLTTQIAEALTGNQKRVLGRAAYIIALLKGIVRMRKFHARLELDDGEHSFETLQVVVGNGRYHAGPFPLHPDAAIVDGKLNVYAVVGTSPIGLLKVALHLPGGRHVRLQEVPAFLTSRCRLVTRPSKRVTIDGEIKLRTPAEFSIAPRALRVVAPADSELHAQTTTEPTDR
jgi:YegS/Rv2252/BmrU family lipid kinase